MTTVDLVDSRLLDLTADDADMRRCHACDLRPSVSSAVYFQRLGRTQHTDKTDDRPNLVAGSIADRLYSILSCRVQIKHREQSVRPQPRWLPLFQWSNNRRGDGQRKRYPSKFDSQHNTLMSDSETHKTITAHRVRYPDGTISELSQLDSGVQGLFDTAISSIKPPHGGGNEINTGPLAEISWRLRQAKFCYTALRSLHAGQIASYLDYLNSKNPNSSPVILLSPTDPFVNVVAGNAIIALHVHVETLYLYLSRVIQVFRDVSSLQQHKSLIEKSGKGCLQALNQLVKHSDPTKWNEDGLFLIPTDMTQGISLKPNSSELKLGAQDSGTIVNTREFLNALTILLPSL